MKQRLLSLFAVLVTIASGCQGTKNGITVSAASDLTNAFQEVGREFERKNGTRVTFVFGSTGQLAQQIEQGAPTDVFAAANVAFIDELERAGFIVAGTKQTYGIGRIALWTRRDANPGIEKLEDLARDGVRRIAIANPDHAPYGIAARESLQATGLWDKVKPRIIFAENISQTLQYAESGNVDVAIVALSLCIGSQGTWTLIPDNLHKPIVQSMAVIKGTKNEEAARSFVKFVNDVDGRLIMQRFGFSLPGELTR